MSDPEWTNEVRHAEWSLEMIFRWLEESAAFLHDIETHRGRPGAKTHQSNPPDPKIESSGHSMPRRIPRNWIGR